MRRGFVSSFVCLVCASFVIAGPGPSPGGPPPAGIARRSDAAATPAGGPEFRAERTRGSTRFERPAQDDVDKHEVLGAAAAPFGPPAGDPFTPAEVEAVVHAAANAVDDPGMTIAVVDRQGNVLALFRKAGAAPGVNDDIAVGLARTAAFYSNSRAPLSSRTVRFISGKNFPNGVAGTPAAALYGVENSNRGCEIDPASTLFNPGRELPPAKSVAGLRPPGLPCNAFDQRGCGLGVVTGKFSYQTPVPPMAELSDDDPTAVNPGGVPVFRVRPSDGVSPIDEEDRMLGGIGVAGIPAPRAEYAAFIGAFGIACTGMPPPPECETTAPVFTFPLPAPGNVFIDGIRLPFVKQVTEPPGTTADPNGFASGAYDPDFLPRAGEPAPVGYLIGPRADPLGNLSLAEVEQIVRQSIDGSNRTRANVRLPLGKCTRMIISVANLDGELLAVYRMRDALIMSFDVSVAKSRNVVYFSTTAGNMDLGFPVGTAVSNRGLGFGGQPLYPSGIAGRVGPFFDEYLADVGSPGDPVNKSGFCRQADDPPSLNQSGIIWFPGSSPLYGNGLLVGGLGISGDGVEQDDYAVFLGAQGFLPPPAIRNDAFAFENGVRIPFFKFPREPEACSSQPDPFIP